MDEQGVPPLSALSVGGARRLLDDLFTFDPEQLPPVGRVRDLSIPGGDVGTELPVRVYEPDADGPAPVVVYFHGGGWVVGNLDTHDATCRTLAAESGSVVVSVDYRLAPEHPFPAPVEDCYAALEWVAENAAVVGGDPGRLAVAGDSAGGNLAAAVALLARDRDGPSLAHQVLVYPVTDFDLTTDSYEENAEGYFLTREDMAWFWDHYLERPVDRSNPYAAPLQARDLSNLPPATVVTAGFDPLRDEGVAYADRLDEAGTSVSHHHYEGVIHGFFGMVVEPELEPAHDAVRAVCADLHDSFG